MWKLQLYEWNKSNTQANQEKKNLIAFIRITDINELDEGAFATIRYGGVGHTYAGILLESEEGAIHSRIEIYEYEQEPIEEWTTWP